MAKVSLRAYNREIEAMIDRNHLDEAVAHCQHILKTFPKHIETYRLLGKAYLEARRHDEAVDIFTRVLAAVPNDFVAHVGMSIVRDEQNKLDDAIWHMERAYESQSANSAIQAELQRLYGRREGVQPPRVRMTRGALANMYMRGELYPQAISESKGILEEDPGRSDMQVLLAKAYYKSGQKKDAADAASSVLKRYPFCLDANLVLAEILGADRPESAQGYRQRVIELDPYASQADDLFHAAEVSDAAISLERLDWSGQPEGMTADWRTAKAISLESGISGRDEQPDWKKVSFGDETPLSAPALDSEPQPALPADDIPDFLKAAGWGASTGAFDESKASAMFDEESAPAAESIAQGDLPDWIKAMKPAETDQSAGEQAEEIPDWINKIGTSDLPLPSAEGEAADWLANLDQPAGESQPSAEGPDWLKELGEEQPAPAPAAAEDLDWLKDLETGEQPVPAAEDQPAPAPAAAEDLDWLKDLETGGQPVSSTEEQTAPAPAAAEDLDWLKELETGGQPVSSTEEQPAPAPAAAEDLDWLKDLETGEQPVSSTEEQPDWLKGFGQEEQPAPAAEDQPDWLKDLSAEEPTVSQLIAGFDFSAETPEAEVPSAAVDTGSLGTSEKEQDDAFAWLEALAAKQGASEGLLTKPEERLEQEPDWVRQVKKVTGELQPLPESQPAVEEAAPAEPEPVTAFEEQVPAGEPVFPEPVSSLDAQPAVEEAAPAEPEPVLAFEEQIPAEEISAPEPQAVEDTQPTRVHRPPVEQEAAPAEPEPLPALEGQVPVEEIPAREPEPLSPPLSSVEELGKSEAERDDSFAWLESLAAKQGASEGLLTKPEERLSEEPEWVRRLKSAGNTLKPAPAQPAREEVSPEPSAEAEQAPVAEEAIPAEPEPVSALEAQPSVEEAAPTEPEPVAAFEEPLIAEPEPASQPMASAEELGKSEAERDDSFAWLEALAAKQGATEGLLTKPEERLEEAPEWVKQAKELREEMPTPVTPPPAEPEPEPEPEPLAEETAPAEDVPAWVKGLGEVEEAEPEPIAEDATAAWLRSLDEPQEAEPVTLAPAEDLPAWMQELEREEEAPAAEPAVPTVEAEIPAESPAAEPQSAPEELPAWLHGLVEEEQAPAIPVSDDLPAWMRDETGEVVAEPTKIEPTRSTDWAPLDETKVEAVEPPPPAPQPAPEPKAAPAPKAKKPAKKETVKPAAPPEPYREPITTIRGTGMLSMPVDPVLASARAELTRSNIPGALDTYGKLIKKGRFLEEVIFDLREALYRYPVEVSIWQALGDAYMRANRLQDALDAYTKAEELLR